MLDDYGGPRHGLALDHVGWRLLGTRGKSVVRMGGGRDKEEEEEEEKEKEKEEE